MQATLTINSRYVVTLPAKFCQAMGLKVEDKLIAGVTQKELLPSLTGALPVELHTHECVQEVHASAPELVALQPIRKLPRQVGGTGCTLSGQLGRRGLFAGGVRPERGACGAPSCNGAGGLP